MSDSQDASAKLMLLFEGMDDALEEAAVEAMKKARLLLQENELGFGALVMQARERKLLMPSKLGGAIGMMDSTTEREWLSAFRTARSLMKTYGIGFKELIDALNQGGSANEVEELKAAVTAYQRINRDLATQNADMEKENIGLRSEYERLLAEFEAAQKATTQTASPSSSFSPQHPQVKLMRNDFRELEGDEYRAASYRLWQNPQFFKPSALKVDAVLGKDEAVVTGNDGNKVALSYHGRWAKSISLTLSYSRDHKFARVEPSHIVAMPYKSDTIAFQALPSRQRWLPKRLKCVTAIFNNLFEPA